MCVGKNNPGQRPSAASRPEGLDQSGREQKWLGSVIFVSCLSNYALFALTFLKPQHQQMRYPAFDVQLCPSHPPRAVAETVCLALCPVDKAQAHCNAWLMECAEASCTCAQGEGDGGEAGLPA